MKIVEESGELTPFSVDRFAVSLVRRGVGEGIARSIAQSVELAGSDAPGKTLAIGKLRDVADAAASNQLLDGVVAKTVASDAPAAVEITDPLRSGDRGAGPIEMSSWILRSLTAVVSRRHRGAGRVLDGLVRIACSAAERVYADALPSIVDGCGELLHLSPPAHARLRNDLFAVVPYLALDVTAAEIAELGKEVSDLPDPDPTAGGDAAAAFKRAMREVFISTFGGRGDHTYVLDDDEQWVKVGSTERPSVLPSSVPFPLFCVEPCDWNREDEPRGAELTYRGIHWLGLDAPTDSVSAGVVRGVWLEDWTDLPANFTQTVELGLHVDYYTWFLTEFDGLSHSKLEEQLRDRLKKMLQDKQKDLIDKAQKKVEEMLKGTPLSPAGPVAGQVTEIVLQYLVPFIVAIVTDNTFPPVSLSHLTYRATEDSEPLSIVLAFTKTGVLPLSSPDLVEPGNHVKPRFKPLDVGNSMYQGCRWWWGASRDAKMHTPIFDDVGHSKQPVLWSQALRSGEAPQGFHVLVPVSAPTKKPIKNDGLYVIALRADVRLDSPDDDGGEDDG